MRTILLSIFALALSSGAVLGEDQDQDQPKQPKQRNDAPRTAPQRPVNNPAPRAVTPRVQQNSSVNTQTQIRQQPTVTTRNYTPKTYTPRTNTPSVPPRVRTNQNFTPPNQDAPRTTVNPNTKVTNNYWQDRNRTRNNPPAVITPPATTVPPTTTTPPDATARNRDWRNGDGRNRNRDRTTLPPTTTSDTTVRNRDWRNRDRNWQNNTTGIVTYDQARQRHHRQHHHRSWWRSHYSRIALFAGGYYYWNSGYWYPAYGYDPYYSNYTYDEPIYGYNNLTPGQVIANVQAALQEEGYYNDAVDGLIGPNTRAALSAFQQDRGLPITAAIDGRTLKALGLY